MIDVCQMGPQNHFLVLMQTINMMQNYNQMQHTQTFLNELLIGVSCAHISQVKDTIIAKESLFSYYNNSALRCAESRAGSESVLDFKAF